MDPTASIRRRLEGVNIPNLERVLSVGLGVVGAGVGITAALIGSRRSATIGSAVAVAGLGLIGRGLGGRCPAYRAKARRAAARDQATDATQAATTGFEGATTRQGVRDLDRPGKSQGGEGDRRSARAYNEHLRDFIDDDKVEPAARAAAKAVDGPEGPSLRQAEEAGKAPAGKQGIL